MAERVLTLRQLNRATLTRQVLLERDRPHAVRPLPRVARREVEDEAARLEGWLR